MTKRTLQRRWYTRCSVAPGNTRQRNRRRRRRKTTNRYGQVFTSKFQPNDERIPKVAPSTRDDNRAPKENRMRMRKREKRDGARSENGEDSLSTHRRSQFDGQLEASSDQYHDDDEDRVVWSLITNISKINQTLNTKNGQSESIEETRDDSIRLSAFFSF